MAKSVTVGVRLDEDLIGRIETIQAGMQADRDQRARCRGEVTFSDAFRETVLMGCPLAETRYPVAPQRPARPALDESLDGPDEDEDARIDRMYHEAQAAEAAGVE